MNSVQKNSKKDFTLSQYYSQLEKYETNISNSKQKTLKKDNSISTFSKDAFKSSSNTSKLYKESITNDKPKLGLVDRPNSQYKKVNQKPDRVDFQAYKKVRNEQKKYNSYLVESLANSNISSKWDKQPQTYEKQNIIFTAKDQNKFVEHCSQLYQLKRSTSLVEDIAQQINKRDQVYNQVAEHLGQSNEQDYALKLEEYFREHELMKKIIDEFKIISKLQTEDLNQLYYFLKTDR